MNSTTWTIDGRRAAGLARVGDYIELTKPRISIMVLVTVAVSGYVSRWGQPDLAVLLHAVLGTALIAASASAWNQWLERHSDAMMDRTTSRPLPSGRLTGAEVCVFGLLTLLIGLVYLSLAAGGGTALLGAATWLIYVGLYTPLKRRTPWNTFVGAIAGAMPVLIGWTAVGGQLDLRVAGLFMIVFLWQFPHFMAIAWLYRNEYDTAGLQMATVTDPSGQRAGLQAVLGALSILPVSLVPAMVEPTASPYYLVTAFTLSVGQLVFAIAFLIRRNEQTARRLLRASLLYLPGILAAFMLLPLL